MKMLFFSKILLILLSIVNCEEYNLFGDAGQAYSITTYLGNPKQKLNLIVDTGSTTMAIAAYSRRENDKYFDKLNSTTTIDYCKEVEAKYSQGMWVGQLVSDEISFPSLNNVPEVRSDFAAITKSYKFFMNGSGWHGLLGLAYPPIAAWGDNVKVRSWLEAVDNEMKHRVSFTLELCGPQNSTNTVHYGNLSMIVGCNDVPNIPDFRTPILHERWYEIGVLGVNVYHIDLSKNITNDKQKMEPLTCTPYKPPKIGVCQKLNLEKSILDSGTTNIRLPDEIFKEVVDLIRKDAQSKQIPILDEFWYHGEAACWPEPQEWTLPWISIDLLNADHEQSYFVLQVPPQNYMRIMSARNNKETVSQYCYKLGIEAGGKNTVLGYTAMEGLQTLFNRSAGWIGFSTSACGPNTLLSGPYYVSYSFVRECDLIKQRVDDSIQAAQWGLLAVCIAAVAMIAYLCAPYIKATSCRPPGSEYKCSITRNLLFDGENT